MDSLINQEIHREDCGHGEDSGHREDNDHGGFRYQNELN